jgi:hypothetical protein
VSTKFLIGRRRFPIDAASSGLSLLPGGDYGCYGATDDVVLTTCVLGSGDSLSRNSRTSTVNPTLGTIWFDTCPVTGTTILSAAHDSVVSLAASPIFVKYRPSDIPLLQKAVPTWGSFPGATPVPPTAQPSSSASGGGSGGDGGNSSGASPSPPPSAPSGLSQDAKIAIGVAVPVAVIAFLLSGFLAMRWRKTRMTRSKPAPAPSGPEHLKPELEGQGKPISAPEYRELETAAPRTELASETAAPRMELEG